MAVTAKHIQLKDDNGVNISPMTNIESLYYETSDGEGTIYRQYLYTSDFPARFVIDSKIKDVSLNIATYTDYLHINETQCIMKYENNTNSSILVHTFQESRIPGTNYKTIEVSTYDLSYLLFNYAPKYWVKTKFDQLNTSMNAMNASIVANNNVVDDISKGAHDLFDKIQNVSTYDEVKAYSLMIDGKLIPGHLYRVAYSASSVFIENERPRHAFDVILIATSKNSFCKEAVACVQNASDNEYFNYEKSDSSYCDISKWEVNAEWNSNGQLYITYMKDEKNNEAPFDFKNISCYGKFYAFANGINDLSLASLNCANNVIASSAGSVAISASEILNNVFEGVIHTNSHIGKCSNNIFKKDSSISSKSSKDLIGNIVGNNTAISEFYGTNNAIGNNTTCAKIQGNCNVVGNNCSDIAIVGDNNTIQNISSTIDVSGKCNTIEQECVRVKLNANNSYVYQNCSNINTSSANPVENVIIGQNIKGYFIENSNIFYTNQDMFATSFKKNS